LKGLGTKLDGVTRKPFVLDASTAVAEGLRERGLALLRHERLELFMSEHAWSETRHELTRRAGVIAKRHGLREADAAALLAAGMAALGASVNVMPAESYAPLETVARGRLPADPNDWPTAALALALDTGIWTNDRDFFGSGLATWTTPVLDHYLTTESA